MIDNATTSKRLLNITLLSVLLAACCAEHTSPSLDTLTVAPATPAPLPLADADSAPPQLGATSTASLTPSIPTSTLTSTPGPHTLNWCPGGLITCFDESYTFSLTRPIPIRIDPTYRYASAQDGQLEIHRGVEFCVLLVCQS